MLEGRCRPWKRCSKTLFGAFEYGESVLALRHFVPSGYGVEGALPFILGEEIDRLIVAVLQCRRLVMEKVRSVFGIGEGKCHGNSFREVICKVRGL